MTDRVCKVSFMVFVRDIPNNISHYEVDRKVAQKLSISLMLRDLDVNIIEINGIDFNIGKMRKENDRF